MSDDDHITLEKLLEKDEQVLAKLPYRKGAFEICCLLFAGGLLVLSVTLISRGFFTDWCSLEKLMPFDDLIGLAFFILFGPFFCLCLFNAKMVFTNKKIIKDSHLWASVEAKSWADVKKVSAKNDVLILELKETGKTLSFKTKDAVRLKAEFGPLLNNAIEDKESAT
jgi:hypothetical protein